MQAATIALLLVVALVFAPPRLLLPLPLDIGEVSEVVEDVVLSVSITWRTVVAKKGRGISYLGGVEFRSHLYWDVRKSFSS